MAVKTFDEKLLPAVGSRRGRERVRERWGERVSERESETERVKCGAEIADKP